MYHLYKLYKDLNRSNLEAVKVASLVTTMISVNQTPSSFAGGGMGSGGLANFPGAISINGETNNRLLQQNHLSHSNQGTCYFLNFVINSTL